VDPQPNPPAAPLLAALARAGVAAEAAEQPEIELFRVSIAGEPFAIEAGLIHEVVRAPPITPLPGAPAFLAGVAAHRGDVLAVVDLAQLLGRGATGLSGRSRMAIARADGMVVAVLADEVLGLSRFATGALHPAPLGAQGAELLSGVIFEGRILHILDLRRALAIARERDARRS
jgi:purine-binding chemotaxis protein CheW